ncbi:molybdenum cofactor synthesis protein cinnamon [Brevipalpus obovatus]|uniref:molybdenum cofactor synthesis protein cinnamon n=1 Tax=Brevipalpus obovatus TaxID=246614 RepID=UPI003D9E766D
MSRSVTRIAVITVSDRCSQGISEDQSGPYIRRFMQEKGHEVVHDACIPDDFSTIQKCLVDLSDSDRIDVILTTGGTGFTDSDVTPEATKSVLQKEASGIVISMISQSIKFTQFAALSRPYAGIRNSTLIINLPGSLKAVREYCDIIQPLLNHAVDQMRGDRLRVRIKHCEIQEPSKPIVLTIKDHSNETMSNSSESILTGCGGCSHGPSGGEGGGSGGGGFPHRKSPYEMINIQEAVKKIIQELNNPNISRTHEVLPIKNDVELLGRRSFDNIHSMLDIPPFPASIKDGYAVISAEGSGHRKVLPASITAGLSPDHLAIDKGWCARINTGAPVPDGADAVVQVEDTKVMRSEDGIEKEILIETTPRVGQDIRKRGSDISKEEMVLASGSKIGPIELGLLASIGVASVKVYRRPRVAILSTGDELKEPGQVLGKGSIYDSNRLMLISFLRRYGCQIIDLGIVRDEVRFFESKICSALEKSDILVTTGSVSMGEKDILKSILTNSFGCKIHFARVNLKPGKPTTLATCTTQDQHKLIFGLPGNPVSAFVTCFLFLVPVIDFLSGGQLPEKCEDIFDLHKWMKVRLILDKPLPLDERPEFVRSIIDFSSDVPEARLIRGSQMSSRLISCHDANAIVRLPSRIEMDPSTSSFSISSGFNAKAILINT